VQNFGIFFSAVVFAAGCFMGDGKVAAKPGAQRIVIIHLR